jgi:hypothetical protein
MTQDNQLRRCGNLGGIRQWIESVYGTVKDQLSLETPQWPHPRRSVRPHRPAAARPGRMHRAQLVSQDHRPALPDRLRPLNPSGITHPGEPNRDGVQWHPQDN